MKFLSRVVWSEGMYLGPHHFQIQSRYFDDSLLFATDALWFRPYGLAGCRLDDEALLNGTVSVVHARGVLPDGLAFNMPECDSVPAPLSIADIFPPTRDSLTIHLTIPERRDGGRNCALPEDAVDGSRFTAEERVLPDETTGSDERRIRLGRKNLRLAPDHQLPPEAVTLPIARVLRDGSGHFVYDADFVPPCVQISACDGLMLRLRRLIEILEEKGASLNRGSGTELSARDISSFWLLHAINSGVAPLRHLWISKRGHPEELFLEMSRLGGALCTFALDSHPRTLPVYDHDNLTECFAALDRHIRTHLEIIIPTNCVTIPLKPAAPYFYEGDVTDTRCLGRAQWIFGIRAGLGEADLITRVPQLVKICSSRFVPELVKRALPGMTLTQLAAPPAAVTRKIEMQYFGITRSGPCWDHIVQSRQVGVYVPGELPDIEMELLAVLEG